MGLFDGAEAMQGIATAGMAPGIYTLRVVGTDRVHAIRLVVK